MDLGKKLRRKRDELRLSQQEVADRIGVSASTYRLWEMDQVSLKIEYLPKLAQVFMMSPLDFLPENISLNQINSEDSNLKVNPFKELTQYNALNAKLIHSLDTIIDLFLKVVMEQNHNLQERVKTLENQMKKP